MTINYAALVDSRAGTLQPRIYHDREIYERVLEQIFGRCWQFLAHDSMLQKTGDFLQTYMGEDPILVVRQRDGSVKAFMNQCRHRGMRICRADQGNIKAFTCTYHGWTYDIAGRLINVPHEDDGYHNELDKDAWGPIQVAKVESYKGFWFGTWDASAPSLSDYLGDMKWYFDACWDRWNDGFEIVPGMHRWVIDCNWKFAAEQFASDNYHAEVSHGSAIQVGFPKDSPVADVAALFAQVEGRQFSAPQGHGTGIFLIPPFNVDMRVTSFYAEHEDEAIARVGELRAKWISGSHNTVFPNFSYLAGTQTMRVWHPRGPGQIEVWAWGMVPKAAPEEIKNAWRISILRTFSAAGIFEQDDGENWNEVQKVLRGYVARRNAFNLQMGLGHATSHDADLPGTLLRKGIGEEAARGLYQRWADLMTGASWAELDEFAAARQAQRELEESARS